MFTSAGLTKTTNWQLEGDSIGGLAWHPDGTLWMLVTRYDSGSGGYKHYIDIYDPETATWSVSPLEVAPDGGASIQPYAFDARKLVINKAGTALVVWCSGSYAGGARTWWRFVYSDLSMSAITELLDGSGNSMDYAWQGGGGPVSLFNGCTDFTIGYVGGGTTSYQSLSAVDINSETLAVENRRVVFDGTDWPTAASTVVTSVMFAVSPTTNTLHTVFEIYRSTGSDQRRFIADIIGNNETKRYHLADGNLKYIGDLYYNINPVAIADNIDDDVLYVMYEINTKGSGSPGNTAMVFRKIVSGVDDFQVVIFEKTTSPYSDAVHSLCIDGNGNVFFTSPNNTFPTYTSSSAVGNGVECWRLLRDQSYMESLGCLSRYVSGYILPTENGGLAQMRPTTKIVAWALNHHGPSGGDPAEAGDGIFFNLDSSVSGYVDSPEAPDEWLDCEGVPATYNPHKVFVWDERSYKGADGAEGSF